MRKSAAEYIRELELRIAHLERQAAAPSRRQVFLESWNERADLKTLFGIIASMFERSGYKAVPMKMKGTDLYMGILIKGESRNTFEIPEGMKYLNTRQIVVYGVGGANWQFSLADWSAGLWVSFDGRY